MASQLSNRKVIKTTASQLDDIGVLMHISEPHFSHLYGDDSNSAIFRFPADSAA